MTDPGVSALVAFASGFALAFLLVVPYIAWSYRRRGELGVGHAVLALAFLVYLMSLWTYTLLPVPDSSGAWCAGHIVHPQTHPLQLLADIRTEQVGVGIGSYLHNPAIQQTLFNVALFVPLGMFLRHLFRRGPLAVIATGFVVSLAIECTQLTSVWGLYSCPYRLFDVDDLLTNTAGTAIGYWLAPALRLMPGQRVKAAPGVPRPVTTRRRLLGMLLDLLSVNLIGGLLLFVLGVAEALLLGSRPDPFSQFVYSLIGTVLPAVLLLLVVPMLGNGGTVGQRIVLLRPVGPDGAEPSTGRMLLRFLTGSGGYFLLVGPLALLSGAADQLGGLLLLVSGIMAWRPRDHRGLSGVAAGLRVLDSREPAALTPSSPRESVESVG